MDIFTYVASNNEEAARAICGKYGFIANYSTPDELGLCLQQTVAEAGEPAMKDIYSIHPDKDQIISLYGNSANNTLDCGCNKKSKKGQNTIEKYVKDLQTNNNTQIQFCIVAAALLLAAAIISK